MKLPSVIKISGLTKYYPETRRKWGLFTCTSSRNRPAVDNISLEIEQGQFFGLLGQNGAGKTTLIKMLSTLITPTSGKAEVNGYPLRKEAAIKRSIGIVSGDERSFFWRLTGRQNLEFFAALYGIKSGRTTSRVEYLLELIGLTDAGDEIFRSYSTGMKQQLSIARALINEPPVLFLDEPTKGLDPLALKRVHEFFKVQLNKKKGITILMTTHRLDEAEKLCDRIAIMHQGRILTEGTIADLRRAPGFGDRYQITAIDVRRNIAGRIERSLGGFETVFLDEDSGMIKFEIAGDGENLGKAVDLIRADGGVLIDIRHVAVSLESIYESIIYPRRQPATESPEIGEATEGDPHQVKDA